MPIDADRLLREVQAKVAGGRRTWVKRRTLTSWAGMARASAGSLDEMQQTLLSAGLGLAPLPLRHVRPDESVILSRCPLPERRGLPLDRERDLEELLLRYWRSIPELAGLTSLTKQKRLLRDGRMLRCDLYGRDSRSVVVIELKLGDGGYKPGSQIREYIRAEQAHQEKLARPRPVRGIVISAFTNQGEEEEVRLLAAREGLQIDWYYFDLRLELVPAPA